MSNQTTNLPVRRRSKINIFDKKVLNAIAEALARAQGVDVMPKDCRNDARTIMSAYILGQDVETAAQRLLTWWCIDCGMKTLTLDKGFSNTAHTENAERVMISAKAGYAVLEAVERDDATWVNSEPKHYPSSVTVLKK